MSIKKKKKESIIEKTQAVSKVGKCEADQKMLKAARGNRSPATLFYHVPYQSAFTSLPPP